jgi:hypothetical protein
MPPDATTPTRTPAVGPAALVAFAMPGLVALTALTALVALGGACTGEAAPATSGGMAAGGSGGGGGGGAGGGGAGGGGGGVVPKSCRDHRIHLQELPEWMGGYPVWNARWVHRGKLYTGATFLRASELTLNGVHTELALYAVDLASGDQSVTSPHLIPEGYHGDIYALGGAPDGTFLVVYSHDVATGGGLSELYYALGKLGSPRIMDLGELFPQLYLPTRVTWDGEAFQVHGENGATVAVARVSTSGEVLLPKTDFGVSWNPGYGPLGYRLEYEPVTELTWIWDGDGAGSGLVQAHDKLGTPLFPYPGVVVDGVEEKTTWGSAMSARPDGVSLVWEEQGLGHSLPFAERVSLEGEREGAFAFAHGLTYDTFTLLDRGERRAAVVAVEQYGAHLLELDYDTGSASEAFRFYDNGKTPDPFGPKTDLREMRLFEVDGTLWLVFHEAGQGLDAPVWRVLELNPGCVYKSWLRLVEDGETGVE